ncbi:hypothetical protein D3C72_1432430 [compost metagenome]
MKVGVELESRFGDKLTFKSNDPKFNVIIMQKRFDAVGFALSDKTYKWSGVGFCFKIDKMFELSCHTNNQFLEIMLMYFVFGLLYAQCLVGVNFVNFEKSVQNKEDFNLLFTNIRFQLHFVCQRPSVGIFELFIGANY